MYVVYSDCETCAQMGTVWSNAEDTEMGLGIEMEKNEI